MKKNYQAMVLSCIDPRFQPIVFNYLKKRKLSGKYSSFTIAGSAIGITANKFKKWHKVFWDNFATSVKLHNIKKLIVINHRDCGAAKIINGKKEFTSINETKVHKTSFQKFGGGGVKRQRSGNVCWRVCQKLFTIKKNQ